MQKIQVFERVIDKASVLMAALGLFLAGATLVLGA
jgi:hypothetical protein